MASPFALPRTISDMEPHEAKASSCQECMICGFLQQSEGHPREKWRRTEGERNNFSTHPWFPREKDSLTDIGVEACNWELVLTKHRS